MRLGLILLFTIIVSALAIWGCIAVIDTQETLNMQVSGDYYTIENAINIQNEA